MYNFSRPSDPCPCSTCEDVWLCALLMVIRLVFLLSALFIRGLPKLLHTPHGPLFVSLHFGKGFVQPARFAFVHRWICMQDEGAMKSIQQPNNSHCTRAQIQDQAWYSPHFHIAFSLTGTNRYEARLYLYHLTSFCYYHFAVFYYAKPIPESSYSYRMLIR